MTPLPIDPHLDAIAGHARARRAVVVVAPPGAGKTTRVPPALLALGPVILLEPRRIAARAIARRIAEERGLTLGDEVGWQVRFERRFGPRTRLLVATEGILTARLQGDPLLGDFAAVVLDEFHERSLHADLALALCREAARARGDLAIVVMSATLDPGPIAAYLGDCPVVAVAGREHPVAVSYRPELSIAAAVRETLAAPGGHVLCFLPGAPEIRRAAGEIANPAGGARVVPLHGSLDADAQDAALRPSAARKVILATNIAETSLTVEGVTDVVDSGLEKVLRHDPARGIERLATERIALDSAAQRAGRAGRTAPGRAIRLWHPGLRLEPRREPEVFRADLAATYLEILAWGAADVRAFPWFEPPPEERSRAALELLALLGAVQGGRLTALGETLRRFPLHPRLARVLVDAGGTPRAAAAVAALADRDWVREDTPETTDSDVLARADRIATAPYGVRQAVPELTAIARRVLGPPPEEDDDRLRRALLAGYPDRVAARREPGSPRLLLASGTGAILGRPSGVREGVYLVAHDLALAPDAAEAVVRLATRIEREWIEPTGRERVHGFDAASGKVSCSERAMYGAIVLGEQMVAPDPEVATGLLVAELRRRGLGERAERVRLRLAFAGIALDLAAVLAAACAGRTALPEIDLAALLPPAVRRDLDRLAPEAIAVPSGRTRPLEYRADGSVVLSVKLQELFGLGETPRIGPRKEPLTLSLLSPSGRPVQTTRDLESFWARTYPAVRKELRARYPKHPWPEDPWSATPTARTKAR